MLSPEEIAASTLRLGNKYPYDAPDGWDVDNPPPPIDWAHSAARGVLADLNDRGGIKHGFVNIDAEIRAEIVTALAAIIRAASEGAKTDG